MVPKLLNLGFNLLQLRMSACSNRFSQCCPSWSLVKPVVCWEWWQPPTARSTSAFARMERTATARDLPERWQHSITMVFKAPFLLESPQSLMFPSFRINSTNKKEKNPQISAKKTKILKKIPQIWQRNQFWNKIPQILARISEIHSFFETRFTRWFPSAGRWTLRLGVPMRSSVFSRLSRGSDLWEEHRGVVSRFERFTQNITEHKQKRRKKCLQISNTKRSKFAVTLVGRCHESHTTPCF